MLLIRGTHPCVEKMEVKAKIITRTHFSQPCLFLLMLTLGLYLTSLYNYLLFHTLSEIFSIIVAAAIFIFAWNTRYIQTNFFFLFLGIAYLFTGILDLLHCLSYKGMNIFASSLDDPASQLWVAARYMESISLLIGFYFLRRRPNEQLITIIYFVITSLVLLAIFIFSIFPECYIEGEGLTKFKKNSEYFIALMLAGSLFLLQKNRSYFDLKVLRLMQAAILFTIAAELSFTFYITVYDLSNFTGQFCRIFSFYSIYRAVIENGLTQPYNMLFRELSTHKAELENKVLERTAALQQSTENLQEEIAEHLKTEKELLWELSVNRALAEISDALLSQTFSIKETEELVLKAAKQLTGSEYGLATSIAPVTQHITEEGKKNIWGEKIYLAEKNKKSIDSSDKKERVPCGPWSRVLQSTQGFYTNSIASYTEVSQQGPYRNYLNVPAVIDNKPVGQIALANKLGNFNRHDLEAVERLAAVFALSIQRKQMEISLSRSECKYRSLFNDAPDMIHIVNKHKRIIDVNPIELQTMGYSKEAFIGTHLLDTIHPDFKEKTANTFEQIFSTGQCIKNYETALITQSGEQVDVEVSAVPQLDNDRVLSVRAIMRNITDRKREELEKKKL
ncbi:MAG: PAS domain S-box protein [Candidatus Electrothrix sp. AR3]|nr:PAS domain S-box protein [Candidatus Electrothrix sp. AR3]